MTDTENPYGPIMVTIGTTRVELRLTVATMRKLRKYDPPIDITKLVDPHDPHGGLYAHMIADPGVVVDIVFEALRGEQGIPDDPTEFAKLIGGDQLEELTQAALRAIVAFSPSPRNREILTRVIDRVQAIDAKLHGQAIEKLDDPAIDDQIMQTIAPDLGLSTDESSTCKASSESTQGDTRSES